MLGWKRPNEEDPAMTGQRPAKRQRSNDSSPWSVSSIISGKLFERLTLSDTASGNHVENESLSPSPSHSVANEKGATTMFKRSNLRKSGSAIFAVNKQQASYQRQQSKTRALAASATVDHVPAIEPEQFPSLQRDPFYARLVRAAHYNYLPDKVKSKPSIQKELAVLQEFQLKSTPTSTTPYKLHDIRQIAAKSLQSPLPLSATSNLFSAQRAARISKTDQEVAQKRIVRRLFRKQLDPEQQAVVDQVLRKAGVLSTMPGAEVTDKDIRKLKPGVWLNDEVINFYMILLNKRSADYQAKLKQEAGGASKENQPVGQNGLSVGKKKKVKPGQEILNVHCFTSFFFEKLDKAGFDGVKRWTRKVDLFSKDAVLMPINLSNTHWVSACINLRQKRFEFYDSMGQWNQGIIDKLRAYLMAEHLDKKKKPLDLSDWEDYVPNDVPQQSNGVDCGVFTSQMMEACSRKDGPLDFRQENMPYLRQKMIYEIVKQQFLDEEWS